MAISVNWATLVITVPKADTTLVDIGPPEIRSYDVYEKLWKELKDIEDSEEGMPFLDTQSHNPPVTVSGLLLARVIQIINGYTVEFEDGQYQVNLLGANHNVGDVRVANQVSLATQNSAGLITIDVAGGVTDDQIATIAGIVIAAQRSTLRAPGGENLRGLM